MKLITAIIKPSRLDATLDAVTASNTASSRLGLITAVIIFMGASSANDVQLS